MISRVLIVDDEPLARERLAELTRRHAPDASLREAGNGADAVTLIGSWRPEVVLLDIQMPGGTGFDVIETVGTDRMPATLFISAHDEFALQAFEVAAVDYLLKPFDDARFATAWKRVSERVATGAVLEQARILGAMLGARTPAGAADEKPTASASRTPVGGRWADRIVVKHDQRTMVVMLAEVQWIESDGNYVVLHAGKERYQVRETLTSLESRLDPRRFLRVHRQTIVDMRAMKELQPWFGGDQIMILRDGTRLKVSRNYRAEVAKRLAGET
ncbi:MAG TPA: LytTR family DNA-binding domain-containing protein [Gemmatimonas sp.]|uniref:LytR/AlgR family response regulator transcription factor n=1 Tax=Gemmatimonas sp. TaxID=1962908 RepID=UPI002EDB93A9